MISRVDLAQLTMLIKEYILREFEFIHLSQNLIDTIYLESTENGFAIHIPAEIYDIDLYKEKGVIVYTGDGSYAQEVNISGGFSHTHRGYIEDCIHLAIRDFFKKKGTMIKEIIET